MRSSKSSSIESSYNESLDCSADRLVSKDDADFVSIGGEYFEDDSNFGLMSVFTDDADFVSATVGYFEGVGAFFVKTGEKGKGEDK